LLAQPRSRTRRAGVVAGEERPPRETGGRSWTRSAEGQPGRRVETVAGAGAIRARRVHDRRVEEKTGEKTKF